MKEPTHVYTDEQTQYLRDASTTKVSYKQMSLDFNARFGTRLTRNSILGKCNRLGLRAIKQPSKVLQTKRTVTRTTPLNRHRIARAAQSPARAPEDSLLRREGGRASEPVPARERFTGSVEDVFDAVSHAKPFLELRRGQCRWPASSDASMACGAKCTIGSYCTKHATLAYRTMPTVSRNRKILAGAGYVDTEARVTIDHMLESGGVDAPLLVPKFLGEKTDEY